MSGFRVAGLGFKVLGLGRVGAKGVEARGVCMRLVREMHVLVEYACNYLQLLPPLLPPTLAPHSAQHPRNPPPTPIPHAPQIMLRTPR